MSNDARTDRDPYVDLQRSPEFAELRSRFRRFVFPMTALFLAWYFLYVLLSTYAHDFMSTRVFGNITAPQLMIDRGVQFEGQSRTSLVPGESNDAPADSPPAASPADADPEPTKPDV